MVSRSCLGLLGALGVLLSFSASQAAPPDKIATHMGRLMTVGFEAGGSDGLFDGLLTTTTATRDATFARTGTTSIKCNSGAGNGAGRASVSPATANEISTFFRAYLYFQDLPSTDTTILIDDLVPVSCSVKLTAAGAVQLYNENAGSVIATWSGTVATGQWYCFELKTSYTATAGAARPCGLRVNGETVFDGTAVVSTGTVSTTLATHRAGWVTAPGANKVCWVDDVALNDSQGVTQNTWPGSGKIVLLKPTGDNAVGTGWVDGDGAGTLFGSVDNTPPVGVGTPADGTQIKNLTSTNTGNYDAAMTTYTAAGLISSDTVTLVQSLTSHGVISTTNARNGAVQIVSNPAQSPEEAVAMPTALAGTWPSNWKHVWGVAQVGDIAGANRGTAPVLRVGKRTSTTRENDCCAMFLYVEYVPAATAKAPPPLQRPNRFFARRRAF